MRHVKLYMILMLAPLMGQSQSQLYQTSSRLYNQGRYDEAIEKITKVIESGKELSDKQVAKAYFLRGNANVDIVLKHSQLEGDSLILSEHKDAYVRAYEDFKKAAEYNIEDINLELDQEFPALRFKMKNMAITLVTQAQAAALSDIAEARLYKSAIEHIDPVLELDDNDHVAHDVKGQALLGLGDSAKAMYQFREGIRDFEQSREDPDFTGVYMYYRLAMLEHRENNSLEEALNVIEDGIRALKNERDRLKFHLPDLAAERELRMMREYQAARKDLNDYRLKLQMDKYTAKELKKIWKERVIEDTDDFLARMTLGLVFEELDKPDSARQQYLNAIKIESGSHYPWYKIGEMYFDKGAQLRTVIMETNDDGKLNALIDESEKFFNLALNPLLKAQSSLPCHKETVRMLELVTTYLDRHQLYEEVMLQKMECSSY